MARIIPAVRRVLAPAPEPAPAPPRRLGPLDVLVLSAWCGLAAGLLEVGARVLGRSLDPTGRLYAMSRHFLWLGPLTNLLLFSGFGLAWAVVAKCWPRLGGWLGPRLILFWAVLPVLMTAGPRIYFEAWVLLALGIVARLAPPLEWSAARGRRWMIGSFPGLLGCVAVLAGLVFGGIGSSNGAKPVVPGPRPGRPTCCSSSWTPWERIA